MWWPRRAIRHLFRRAHASLQKARNDVTAAAKDFTFTQYIDFYLMSSKFALVHHMEERVKVTSQPRRIGDDVIV